MNGLDRSFGGLSSNSVEARQIQFSSSRETQDYNNMGEKTFTSPLRHSTSNYPAIFQQQQTLEFSPPRVTSSLRSSYSGINNIHTRPTSPKYHQPLLNTINKPSSEPPQVFSSSSSISSCPVSPIVKDHIGASFGFESSSLVKTPKNTANYHAHFPTPTSSYVRAASEKGIPLCKLHQLPVDILCKECSELICAKCSRSSVHNSHDCQLIDEMDREKECRDIRSTVEVLESRVSKIQQACGTPYELDLMNRQHEEAVNDIKRDFEKAREYLYRKEQELLESLSMIVQSRVQFSQDVTSTRRKLEDAGSMYPIESVSNYDIANNKYSTVSNLKEKVEFLEIKLKFNGSCIDQDGMELQQKAKDVSAKISELSQHFELKNYPFYSTLKTNYKDM